MNAKQKGVGANERERERKKIKEKKEEREEANEEKNNEFVSLIFFMDLFGS